MNSKETKDEYVKWLLRYNWQWFCTLTLRPGIRPWAIAQLYSMWIKYIEKEERRRISWVRAIEHGSLGGRLHIHALLAGTRRFDPEHAERLWSDLAGGAQIGPYDSESLCLQYTLKSIEDSPDHEVEVEVFDKHLLKPAQLRRIESDMEWLTCVKRSNSNC